MRYYLRAKPGQEMIQQFVAGMFLLSWLILGYGSIGVASDAHSLLQIQKDRITGVLTQVPLRTVLEQLQEKLAIEYVVPEEELDKPVSANLTGESVVKSLSKILALWDYALQVDQQGRVHQIFVVAKAGPIKIEESEVKASEYTIVTFPRKMAGSELVPETSTSRALLPGTEMTSSSEAVDVPNPERDVMASPMIIVPSEDLPQMVIQPHKGEPMIIQPSTDFMQVIPASGYPPMEILPVSEDVRREFMEGHN
jgi:hypothetical protein